MSDSDIRRLRWTWSKPFIALGAPIAAPVAHADNLPLNNDRAGRRRLLVTAAGNRGVSRAKPDKRLGISPDSGSPVRQGVRRQP